MDTRKEIISFVAKRMALDGITASVAIRQLVSEYLTMAKDAIASVETATELAADIINGAVTPVADALGSYPTAQDLDEARHREFYEIRPGLWICKCCGLKGTWQEMVEHNSDKDEEEETPCGMVYCGNNCKTCER